MTMRHAKVSLSLALALSTSACVGQSLGSGSSSSDDSTTKAPNESGASDEQTGGANAEPVAAPSDVAPAALSEDDDQTVQSDRAGCLTFFTAEDGAGSEVEGALAAATNAPRTVFLNRRGGTYTPGRNDSSRNNSSIPKRVVRVAPYEGTDAAWTKVLSCVKEQFADYNVNITDQDPGQAAHIEAVVGDGPQALDLGQGVGGISPFTCGVIERSIVYVFSKVLGGVQSECEVIAHEVGHSLGLEHEYLCEDPMTYLHGCGNKTFQDAKAACGTYSAVACECGRSASNPAPKQNTVQKLLANVGPSEGGTDPNPEPNPEDAPPTISVLAPSDGSTLPGNTDLEVVVQVGDDDGVSDVKLFWEFQGTRVLSCANAAAPVRCDVEGDKVTFTLPVGTGPRAFVAEALDTAGQTTRAPRVTLTLSDETATDSAPTVAITAPAANEKLTRGARVSIRATAQDDSAVREVTLNWQSPTGAQQFRLDNLGNGTFGVDLTVSRTAAAGARTLTVTAVDDAGQSATSAPVTVSVQ